MYCLPQILRQVTHSSSTWACLSCRWVTSQKLSTATHLSKSRAITTRWATVAAEKRMPRSANSLAPPSLPRDMKERKWISHAPSMEQIHAQYKKKNITVMNYVISVMLATVGLSYGSVPLYKMICATTGWGGQPIRAHQYVTATGEDPATRMIPVEDAERIKVTFAASVSNTLPWKFVPEQREVRVLPGETALAFYKAYNKSDKDIIGVATYSVTPAQVAPYFSKIQCFCFEEQRLNAREEVDMPVFFYLDPDLLNDINMRGIKTVTLNYTFFKAKYDDGASIRGLPKLE